MSHKRHRYCCGTQTHSHTEAPWLFKQGQPSSQAAIAPDYHVWRSTVASIDADNPSEAGCLWMFQACRSHRWSPNGAETHLQAREITLPFISAPIYVSCQCKCLARNVPLVIGLLSEGCFAESLSSSPAKCSLVVCCLCTAEAASVRNCFAL